MGSNQGIVQLINKTFQNHFATELKNNPLTLVVGKFSGEASENVDSSSAKDSLAGAVVGKTMSPDAAQNVSMVTKRVNWKSGNIFTPYDPDNSENKQHYCLVENNGQYDVFLCLDNGTGYETGLVSTVKPAGGFGGIINTSDGYSWLKLYSITGKLTQFLSSRFMPVPSFDDIKNAPANTPIRLAQKSIDYWFSKRGSFLRVDQDQSLKEVRWSSKPDIDLRQVTSNPANINFVFSYDGTNSDVSRRGWKFERGIVDNGGSGYTQSVNQLKISAEPTYSPQNLTTDNIAGNDYSDRIGKYGPLIKLVLFSGFLDFPNILNSDRSMLIFNIDASEIEQTTGVTSFDSVALVQNLKTNTNAPIETSVGTDKAFRMSDVITTSATTSFGVGNEVQSTVVSNGTRGIGARIAAVTATNQVEVTRSDGNIDTGDVIYSPTVTKNSSVITAQKGFSFSASSTATQAYLGTSLASGSTVSTVSSVDKGEGQLASDSQVLYSNKLGAGDSITKSEGIRVRFIIGGTDILPI